MPTILCKDETAYCAIAQAISKHFKPGSIIFLNGPIGAGKTTFTKIFGEVIGINEPITSPTFNIIKTYEPNLCHVDGYRLSQNEIELDEYLDQGYYLLIEWSECLLLELKPDLIVNFAYHPKGRELSFQVME